MACNGTKPTNSDPVTLMPLLSAALSVSSNASCIEVIEILVKLYEICAIPYSSMYQPIPFTAFNFPGILTGSPFESTTFLPVIGFPTRLTLPASLMSKAMALARLVEVEFKFIL